MVLCSPAPIPPAGPTRVPCSGRVSAPHSHWQLSSIAEIWHPFSLRSTARFFGGRGNRRPQPCLSTSEGWTWLRTRLSCGSRVGHPQAGSLEAGRRVDCTSEGTCQWKARQRMAERAVVTSHRLPHVRGKKSCDKVLCPGCEWTLALFRYYAGSRLVTPKPQFCEKGHCSSPWQVLRPDGASPRWEGAGSQTRGDVLLWDLVAIPPVTERPKLAKSEAGNMLFPWSDLSTWPAVWSFIRSQVLGGFAQRHLYK